MPPRQKSLTRGRWRALALSFLLHSAIVAVAVLAWKFWKHPPPPVETAGIEATVVDESVLKGAKAPSLPEPQPTPPPPEPEPVPVPEPEEQGPPKPDPAEVERRQEEERLAAEKLEQQKHDQQEKADQEKKAEQEKANREEAEKVAAAKAESEKAAADKAAADKKKSEEAAAKKRAADEAAAKKAADEKARVTREAELRRSLEAEERGRALQNSDEAARWHAAIVARIQRAWIKPASAQPGISCIVSVTQVPGGEVTSVRVESCNGGDAALRESVERAVYSSSPLPSPPDPALFERNLELTFAPTS
jgi:colicin import membrane protein